MNAISLACALKRGQLRRRLALCAALAFTPVLHAEPVTPAASRASTMSDGVVRRIDLANGKITLRHGALPNIGMPPMTMTYQVRPAALLNGVKAGDTVKFQAEEIDGATIVTAIQVVR